MINEKKLQDALANINRRLTRIENVMAAREAAERENQRILQEVEDSMTYEEMMGLD